MSRGDIDPARQCDYVARPSISVPLREFRVVLSDAAETRSPMQTSSSDMNDPIIAEVFCATPERLYRLISVDEFEPESWQPADLRAILIHPLSAPVQRDPQVEVQGDDSLRSPTCCAGKPRRYPYCNRSLTSPRPNPKTLMELCRGKSSGCCITRASPPPRSMRMRESVPQQAGSASGLALGAGVVLGG